MFNYFKGKIHGFKTFENASISQCWEKLTTTSSSKVLSFPSRADIINAQKFQLPWKNPNTWQGRACFFHNVSRFWLLLEAPTAATCYITFHLYGQLPPSYLLVSLSLLHLACSQQSSQSVLIQGIRVCLSSAENLPSQSRNQIPYRDTPDSQGPSPYLTSLPAFVLAPVSPATLPHLDLDCPL